MIPSNEHNTEQSNHDQTSSEKVKCSYLIKYSKPNNDDQKHNAIPYLIPAAKPLGSMIDKDCSYECSSCNIKIGLEDTRFHTPHTKTTSDVKKACLENATHLIRPNSCLCVGCYQKQTSTNNYAKRACIIMACEQIACHIFNSKLIDILKPTMLMNKINFRVQTNEEEKLHKTSFCNAHYDQLLFITQCELCGNRSLQKFKLHNDIVHEYQMILNENNIPATMKHGILICKPCHIYLLLRRDKTTIIPSELEKHCDATITRIINNNKLKMRELESIKLAIYDINMEKKKEENELLMVTSLSMNRSNVFTDYYSIPFQSETNGLALDAITIPPPLVNSTPVATSVQSLTTAITTTKETALATEEAHPTTITKSILETPFTAALTKATEDVKLTVATREPTVLTIKRKRQHTFLDEHSYVPSTKKRIVNQPTVTTDCIQHTILGDKPTIPVHKSTILGVQPRNPVNKLTFPIHKPSVQVVKTTTPVDEPITQVNKSMPQLDKPTIVSPVHKPLYNKSLVFSPVLRPIFTSKWPVPKKQQFKNLKSPVEKPTIADHKRLYNKSIVFSPVLRPYSSSKCSIPKKHEKTPESISPIKKPTKLQTNHSHQNTLDSQSMSPRTEFSELSHQRAGPSILSSTTSNKNQVLENLKSPVEKPMIADHKRLYNKSIVFSPVLRPYSSSKCSIPKRHEKTPESISPIKKPTKLQTNQSHQNTLDSRSTSPRTEFSELSHQRAGPSILSSTTSDMNQVFENLNVPVDKSTIIDLKCLDNKSPAGPPVLSPLFSSKCIELKENGIPLEPVSPIKNPTQLHMNKSHQNTLDSRSTSPLTEFSELSHQRAGPSILSSITSDMNQVLENLNVPVDKSTIIDLKCLDNKSPAGPPVLSPLFSSKCTELKENGKSSESVSPIKNPTQLQTNKSHQNTLDSRSTSPLTEFSELSHQRDGPSILSSITSDMNQVLENLNVPVDKSTIIDLKCLDNKSPAGPPVLSPLFSSKCTELKENGKPSESVSPIKNPTQLQTNKSHQHSLDSRSTSPLTEFSELSHQRAGPSILSSTTSNKNQVLENLKSPVEKPTIADHKRLYNKSIVFSPVLRPYSSSKCSIPKRQEKTPESISPIKKPTKLQTNQSHQNTLDSRSTSPRTEFSELSHQRAGPSILSSTTSDMNQVFENLKVPIDKPVITVEKPMIPVNKLTIPDHTPLDNNTLAGPQVLRPFFSSKCIELKENGIPLEPVSPIKNPTQLHMKKSHQNTLDSRSTSPLTEFSELSHQRAGPSILSSITSDMNQVLENLNVPVDKSTIINLKCLDNKSPAGPPVLSPLFSSKCTELKENGKSSESVSPIKNPVQLQTNKSHQNTLDSRSTSPLTEFSELSHQRAGPSILSSITSDMNQVLENLNVPVDKSTIIDLKCLDNKSPAGPPVLRPLFSSKCTELKENGKPSESVSPIKNPTQLQTNKLHQHSLDSRSTSPLTEFSELSHQRAGPSILSSTTPVMNQVLENLNVPVDKSAITDPKCLDDKSLAGLPVLSPLFSSKCTELKENGKPSESVSPIKNPTQLHMKKSHQNTLDSRSTSPLTEFSELSHQRAGPSILSSITSDMNQILENLNVPVDKSTIIDLKCLDNKSPAGPPVLSPLFSSKCTELKENGKPSESVSPIKNPTQLQTNKLHQHSLDSRSTSPLTEFSELSHHRAGPSILSSITSDMNQVLENLNVPVDKSTIIDLKCLDNKSPAGPPVLSPLFSSKCTELKENGKPSKSVSPIKNPTQLQTIKLHQHSLDSRSTSPLTEFSELSHQRAGPSILSSITSDMNQVLENLNVPVDKSTITDLKCLDNKSPAGPPVLRPLFSSKCTELKENGKPSESVSPIKNPTQLQTNKLHQHSLDSRSTSPLREFSELSLRRDEPSTLLSTTSDMNQLFEYLNVPVNKSTITDLKCLDNKSPVGPPVLSPLFSSKCTELKKNGNAFSPIKKPTRLQTNQLHQHSLDSRHSSLQTAFPELSLHQDEPSTLSSITSDMNQVLENLNVPVDKSTITDLKCLDNKSPAGPPVLRPLFSSKCTELKENGKPSESVSPIKNPTQLQTNKLHQHSLDSRSTSPLREFSELSLRRDEPSTLLSTTSDMNQLFEYLNVPVNKSTITDLKCLDNKSPVGPPVLSPLFSSKCTELKKNGNAFSPIKKPTRLQTNQLHQHSLDSRHSSLQTAFPELSLHQDEPSTLSSTTTDMNQLFENLNVPVDKSTIADNTPLNNKSPAGPPVLSPLFSSKFTVLKENGKPSESVSPIKNPTQLQTNQSHQSTVDSLSTSPHTEFLELRLQPAGSTTLSSATPNMIQLFENLKSPYPSGITFINHLLNLAKYHNLGTLTEGKNKTTYRQRTSNTATTPPHSIHCLPAQNKYQTVSCTDDDDNDLINCDYLSDKCVPSDDKSSDTHFIPDKKTYKSCNIPKQESNLPQRFSNKPSQYHDSGDCKKQVIDLQENSPITIAATTSTISMSITTTEASTNIVSATSPVSTTIAEAIIASEVPATVEMAAVATNTSALTNAVADSTTSFKNTEVPVITDTVTINYDKPEITSTVNGNTTVADAAAVEESATLTMNTNVASTTTNSAVSAVIDADSFTAATTTVTVTDFG